MQLYVSTTMWLIIKVKVFLMEFLMKLIWVEFWAVQNTNNFVILPLHYMTFLFWRKFMSLRQIFFKTRMSSNDCRLSRWINDDIGPVLGWELRFLEQELWRLLSSGSYLQSLLVATYKHFRTTYYLYLQDSGVSSLEKTR